MFPKPKELVLTKVESLTDFGAYTALLDYPHARGMIPTQELSERRNKIRMTRVGKVEVVSVLSVDEEKGFVDLSKKNITLEDVQQVVSGRQKGKHEATVDVICYRYNGVEVLKEALLEGLSVSPHSYIHYENHTYTVSSDEAETTRKICEAIAQRVIELGGNTR